MKKMLIVLLFAAGMVAWQWPDSTKTFEIKGSVTDETGQPLIGANVLLVGTKEGTITNLQGYFTLESKDSCSTIEVSYTGYDSQELKHVCAGKHYLIELTGGKELEEVVVTGYGIQKRKQTRGAISMSKQAKPYAPKRDRTAADMGYAVAKLTDSQTIANNTEDYSYIQENRFLQAAQNPLSTFSIDVDAASYSNMRRFIKNGQLPPPDAVRIEELVNYFHYDYDDPAGAHPFEVFTEIAECPWQPKHKLLHVGMQGKRIETQNLPASNIIFLIDVSGSMDDINKLPLLQSSFKLLTDQLREQDKVAIVVYAGAAGVVLPSTSGDQKQKIKEAISQLRAGGSTAGGQGIKLAYDIARQNLIEGGNNRVILATDGDFNVGASSDADLVRMIEKERESGIFLTVLGFGMGNYKDNKMQQLANKGNGNHAYIDDISEAKKVLVGEFGGTLFTIAKDVKIQIEFNPAKVNGYRLIGYENRLLNKEDFNDDKKDAGELGAGHTVTAIYEIIPAGVQSEFLASVDPLKYQPNEQTQKTTASKDMCTIKLRYKKPDGDKSQLLEKPVLDAGTPIDRASENLRWAAAVAEFGMLLRNSEFKAQANYTHCLQLAEKAKGSDEQGYRRQFIEMIEVVKSLADPELAGKD